MRLTPVETVPHVLAAEVRAGDGRAVVCVAGGTHTVLLVAARAGRTVDCTLDAPALADLIEALQHASEEVNRPPAPATP